MKQRVVVVCPGRGSYTKETLGYLKQHGRHIDNFIKDLDERRKAINEPTITELDSATAFKTNVHTKGEHASPLIYSCAYADFLAIDRNRFEIVAVAGNSMGWYLTLAFAGALDGASGFSVVNTMGSMMKNEVIGGQVIYPICNEDWVIDSERQDVVESTVAEINALKDHEVYPSIYLGGYIVLGGNKEGINALLKQLPKVEDYPFQLINHAAFHTPLLESTSAEAFARLPVSLFKKPDLPMIDGRGHIWQPYSTHLPDLYSYTFGHQVIAPYDFSKSIEVALKEFVPDLLILLGPGSTLGGSLGQILIQNDWCGLKSKADFTQRQQSRPLLISMGRPEQRQLVVVG